MSKYDDWDDIKGKTFHTFDSSADNPNEFINEVLSIDGKDETYIAEIDLIDETEKKVTSKDIEFVLDTITKLAQLDKLQIKQIFLGICISQTHIKPHHNINSRVSGEGKSCLLKAVSDLFPRDLLLKFNRISYKVLYHQNGIMAEKNEETNE